MKRSSFSKISITVCFVLIFSFLVTLASCGPDVSTSQGGDVSQAESEGQLDNESKEPPKEIEVTLTDEQLRDKIAGSWVGQMVGVTWAASTEFLYNGVIIPENEVPEWKSAMVNDAFNQDDLYVEVPFMDAMVSHGIDATLEEIAPFFRDSEFMLWHANEQGRRNLRNGISPELAGHYKYNHHADDIDWQIEADYLGNIFPALPSLAAKRAFEIGHLVNYGDGVYGGVFVSAMHSAAFFTDDLDTVIRIGVESIPTGTKFRTVCDQVLSYYKSGITWQECWQKIEKDWGTDDKCLDSQNEINIDAKLNAAYILIGLLWGEGDFEETMLISMRCGQDSDCNPSSAAAVLGTMYGLSGIPEEYKSAVDFEQTKFSYTEYTLGDCIDHNVSLAKQTLESIDAKYENDTWKYKTTDGVEAVPFEQWSDNELTVYMNVLPRNTGEVTIELKCVAPKGSDAKNVKYSFDMGDGTKIDNLGTTYKYQKSGVYTIVCTAEVDGITTKVEKEVDMSRMKGDDGFKVTPSCSESNPLGSGSKDISVIFDGNIPNPFIAQTSEQYDTYGGTPPAKDWYALEFDHLVTVTKVYFTEGGHFWDGGWFVKTPDIEVLIDGEWKKVGAVCSPEYVENDTMESHGAGYETFVFTLETETACRGVRVIGAAGGLSRFVSCAELDFDFSYVEDPTYENGGKTDPMEDATIIVSVAAPLGTGNKNIELIRDGKGAPDGVGDSTVDQYDTYVGSTVDHDEYYGYLFRESVSVLSVKYTEGCNFADGGWFKDGTLRVEALIGEEWTSVDSDVSPSYPIGNAQGDFGNNYDTYTFTLKEATNCNGIRIIGSAGGSAHFTSISELSVELNTNS